MSRLLGCLNGVVNGRDVVLQSGYAYIASNEFGLAIVDVRNVGYLKPIGSAKPPFYAEKVALDGTLAILACNAGGCKVVDCTTKTAPVTVGSLTGVYKLVAIHGSTGYAVKVVPGNPATIKMVCIDLTDPANPVEKGSVVTPTSAVAGMRYSNGRVYVANGFSGVYVIDVSNINSPVLLATVPTRHNQPKDIEVSGTTMYVADNDAMVVIDISNLASRRILSFVPTGNAKKISVVGSLACVLDGNQFSLINVANPSNAILLSAPSGFSVYAPQGIATDGTTLFMAAPAVGTLPTRTGGLLCFNIDNPGHVYLQEETYGEFDNFGIGVSASLGLATIAGNAWGLAVLNVSDPTNPFELGLVPFASIPRNSSFKNVCMDDNYIYAILVTPGNPAKIEFVVVSIATPASPAIVGRVTVTGSPAAMATIGTNYIAIAAGDRLLIIDVTTKTAPAIEGTLSLGGASGIAITTNKAFVAGGANLYSINTTNLTAPSVAQTFALPGSTSCSLGSGNKLYVIGNNQLKVVDVATYTAMVLKSTVDSYGAQGVTSVGDKVFLATPALTHLDTSGGIRVVDTTIPTAPVFVEKVEVPGTTRVITNAGGVVYAGDSAGHIDVIEV